MYKGMLKPKKDASILRKNGSFANKTRCCMNALFVKTTIDISRCNIANKQINKGSWYHFLVLTVVNS